MVCFYLVQVCIACVYTNYTIGVMTQIIVTFSINTHLYSHYLYSAVALLSYAQYEFLPSFLPSYIHCLALYLVQTFNLKTDVFLNIFKILNNYLFSVHHFSFLCLKLFLGVHWNHFSLILSSFIV